MKKTYHIAGMHCKACELLIKKGSKHVAGCHIASISNTTGMVTVDRKDRPDEVGFAQMVEKCGYQLQDSPVVSGSTDQSVYRIMLLAVAVVLTFVLIKVDLFGLLAGVQTDTSLGVIFVLGLVASVSTCLAVTGGVIIGFTELVDKTKDRRGDLKLHGGFQLGRVIGFFVFGALLGVIGQVVTLGLGVTSVMQAIISIVFIYLGVQLIGLVPSISRWGIHLPERWTNYILTQRNPYLAPIVGALTFFLPCGFTQSVQLMSLASGSWLLGGLMMMVFALGTMPGLLALGMGTSFAKDHRKEGFEQIVALLLLVFGMFTLWGSASLRGWTDQLTAQHSSVNTPTPGVVDGTVEKLTFSHDGLQILPETITLQAGKSYELTIVPESDGLGCMSTMTLPRLDTTVHRIQKGVPIVYALNNVQPGQYSFVCTAMGMQHGKLVVQ